MKNISKKSLLSLDILIPPREEQKAIADILSSLEEEIDSLNKYGGMYAIQKRGLMQKLLTGDWRVPVEEVAA